jgi:hypothetical protein
MSYPPALEAMIEAGRFAVRGGIKMEFGEGTFGVWNGNDEFVFDDVTYIPNALISVDDIALQAGTAAAPLTITLPESADFGVTPDKLAEIETLDYKGRTVTIYDFYFDPDTRAFVHADPLHSGYVDVIDHRRSNGSSSLVGRIETAALDNHRDGYRSASNADQQLIAPGDLFFEHAARVQFETFDITLD